MLNDIHIQTESNQFEPLVTIVITNHNHSEYLAEAIQSVLNQAYKNVQIIVVDDGSSDESGWVLETFGGKIEIIWQRNSGVCAARNQGIAAARGTYIGLLDADDMLEPEFLAILVPALLAFPDAEGILCGYRFVDGYNRAMPQVESCKVAVGQLYNRLLQGNSLVPESILLHRRCYESAGPFDLSLSACQDWDMWLTIAKKHHIISADRILTRHRILAKRMSADPVRMLKNRLTVLAKHVGPEPITMTRDNALARRAYASAYFACTIEYLQASDELKAVEFLHRAALLNPAILTQLDTFYELGCGNQPKGVRGYLADLDLRSNTQVLLRMLTTVLAPTSGIVALADKRRTIYATAYWAIGMLAFGKGDQMLARRFMARVIMNAPSALLNPRYLMLLAQILMGKRTSDWLDKLANPRSHASKSRK